MPIELTDQQKQRRAETARANGRKSHGPKTPAGKYIASLNAISTGARADVHEDLLESAPTLLSIDDRRAWVRLLQEQVRQLRPQSEAEHHLIRRATTELYESHRMERLLGRLAQHAVDDLSRELPISDPADRELFAFRRVLVADDKFHRSLVRQKAAHDRAYERLIRTLGSLRKQYPMMPAERPDLAPDAKVGDDQELTPAACEEIAAELTRCANEPSYRPYAYILQALEIEGVLEDDFPQFDYEKIRRHLGITPLPRAA